MIWFLERPGERLQCEIRQSPSRAGYELVWTSNDGRTHVELSDDPEELLQRRRALENWLRRDGWVRPGRSTPPRIFRPTATLATKAAASKAPETT